jgi:TetR/AcrR family transcriptional repressor of lmrAB and yxaGH operons
MTIAPDSKQRMIAATATLMQRQGYHATGLNQIVKEARAPKGSLYFHFPGGKEELAETALAEAAASTPRLQQACARHYGDWQAMMAAYLESFGLPTASARSMAALALASIEGALLLARAYRDVAILREIGQELRALVDARLSSVPA